MSIFRFTRKKQIQPIPTYSTELDTIIGNQKILTKDKNTDILTYNVKPGSDAEIKDKFHILNIPNDGDSMFKSIFYATVKKGDKKVPDYRATLGNLYDMLRDPGTTNEKRKKNIEEMFGKGKYKIIQNIFGQIRGTRKLETIICPFKIEEPPQNAIKGNNSTVGIGPSISTWLTLGLLSKGGGDLSKEIPVNHKNLSNDDKQICDFLHIDLVKYPNVFTIKTGIEGTTLKMRQANVEGNIYDLQMLSYLLKIPIVLFTQNEANTINEINVYNPGSIGLPVYLLWDKQKNYYSTMIKKDDSDIANLRVDLTNEVQKANAEKQTLPPPSSSSNPPPLPTTPPPPPSPTSEPPPLPLYPPSSNTFIPPPPSYSPPPPPFSSNQNIVSTTNINFDEELKNILGTMKYNFEDVKNGKAFVEKQLTPEELTEISLKFSKLSIPGKGDCMFESISAYATDYEYSDPPNTNITDYIMYLRSNLQELYKQLDENLNNPNIVFKKIKYNPTDKKNQLTNLFNNPNARNKVREIFRDLIITNDDNVNKNVGKRHIDEIGNQYVWGTEYDLQILSYLLDIPVLLFVNTFVENSANVIRVNGYNMQSKNKPLYMYLVYYNNSGHFETLVLNNDEKLDHTNQTYKGYAYKQFVPKIINQTQSQAEPQTQIQSQQPQTQQAQETQAPAPAVVKPINNEEMSSISAETVSSVELSPVSFGSPRSFEEFDIPTPSPSPSLSPYSTSSSEPDFLSSSFEQSDIPSPSSSLSSDSTVSSNLPVSQPNTITNTKPEPPKKLTRAEIAEEYKKRLKNPSRIGNRDNYSDNLKLWKGGKRKTKKTTKKNGRKTTNTKKQGRKTTKTNTKNKKTTKQNGQKTRKQT